MKARIFCLAGLVVLAVSILAVTRTPARAAGSWYVSNNGNDANDCATSTTTCASINAALNKPGFVGGDTVLVATGVYTGTGTEVVLINKDATLSGGWDTTFVTQSGMSTIDGQNARNGMYANTPSSTINVSRFLIQYSNYYGIYIGNSISVQISQTTLKSTGLGIYNSFGIYNGGGTISFDRTAIVENGANGIYNLSGNVTFTNSTISGNHSGGYAGSAISNVSGNINIHSSTITNNTGSEAIYGLSGTSQIEIENSILAGNNGGDCWANMTSGGYNIFGSSPPCNDSITLQPSDQVGVNPNLAPLQDNGGNTSTHALVFPSPAINAGNPSGCMGSSGLLDTDQRGFPRVGRCDIGAFEYQGVVLQSYLPLIIRGPFFGIHGHVTLNGSAASGISLDLRFYNGSAWSTFASTSTGIDGSYSFLTAPSLTSGQRYYVRYLNSSDPSRLAIWQTRQLTSYSAGNDVVIGDFDIANINLVSPGSGAVVTLPQTFTWGVRGATPTDSYEFNLFNPYASNGQPWWWTQPPLGYTGNYTLNSLPSGFNINTWYGWFVAVHSPDGGYGESYYYRSVGFLNTGSGLAQRPSSASKNLSEGFIQKPQSKSEK